MGRPQPLDRHLKCEHHRKLYLYNPTLIGWHAPDMASTISTVSISYTCTIYLQ